MSSDFVKLPVKGIPQGVILDKTIATSIPSVNWQFMGGRVVAVLDQYFVGMIDLANFVGGPSCFATSQDYRLAKLCKLKLYISIDGTLKVSIENLTNTSQPKDDTNSL